MASVDHCQLVAAPATKIANYSFSSLLGISFASLQMIAEANPGSPGHVNYKHINQSTAAEAASSFSIPPL